ncbi:ATP-binding protein [Candidatus Saccharibacteria bacterium]|nr:ATP-binding protein [Candidatus Saccharibacteria bacterium]
MATFIMMIGIGGAGKSTLAQFIAAEHEAIILSSSDICKELYGDEICRKKPERVFRIMEERARASLAQGKSVVYDAANLCAKYRQSFLVTLPKKVAKQCIWINAPLELAIYNNASRDKHVAESIIKMQAKLLQPPSYMEGWDSIRVITPSLIS